MKMEVDCSHYKHSECTAAKIRFVRLLIDCDDDGVAVVNALNSPTCFFVAMNLSFSGVGVIQSTTTTTTNDTSHTTAATSEPRLA